MNRLVACLIAAALLGTTMAQVESESSGADRLQNCLVEDHIPDEPATAEQGGFLFEFQSYRGVTEDDRACTVYRLRNTPGKPPTPFRWMLGEEPVVDKARLGRCADGGDACPWTTFVKYFAGRIDTNLSSISYGLNADAFHEQATTYMSRFGIDGSETAEGTATTASSVGTEIAGTFETADGSEVDVHLLVKSRFQPAPTGQVELIYEIDDLSGRGALASNEVRIVWDALQAIGPVASLMRSAEETGVADLSIDGVGSLVRTENSLAITIEAAEFVLDDSFMFEAYAGDDVEPLVSVGMAAYVPVASRP